MTRPSSTSSLKGSLRSANVSSTRGRASTRIQEWRVNVRSRLHRERAEYHRDLRVPHRRLLAGPHRPGPRRTARKASLSRNGSISLKGQGNMCAPTADVPVLSPVSSKNTSAPTQERGPTPAVPVASPSRPRVTFTSTENLTPTG